MTTDDALNNLVRVSSSLQKKKLSLVDDREQIKIAAFRISSPLLDFEFRFEAEVAPVVVYDYYFLYDNQKRLNQQQKIADEIEILIRNIYRAILRDPLSVEDYDEKFFTENDTILEKKNGTFEVELQLPPNPKVSGNVADELLSIERLINNIKTFTNNFLSGTNSLAETVDASMMAYVNKSASKNRTLVNNVNALVDESVSRFQQSTTVDEDVPASDWKRDDTTMKKIYMSGADWISNRFSAVLFWYNSDYTIRSGDDYRDSILTKEGFAVRFGSITIPQPRNESFDVHFGEQTIKKLKPTKLLERKAQFSLRLDSNLYWMEHFGKMSGIMLQPHFADEHTKNIARSYPIGNNTSGKKLCLIIACQDLSNYGYFNKTRNTANGWTYFFEDIKITGVGDSIEYNSDGGIEVRNIDFIFKKCYRVNDVSDDGVTLVS